LQLANATSRPVGHARRNWKPSASHPSVEKANATVGTPASFADEQFSHRRLHLHQQVRPETAIPLHHRPRADRAFEQGGDRKKPANYLIDDLPQRLAKGAVKFHIKAQLAAPGDQTKDRLRPGRTTAKWSIWAR